MSSESLVSCEECGASTGVNWYCPACGGSLCDTCNEKLKIHAKKHRDVVRLIEGKNHSQIELEELKKEQKELEARIQSAAELNNAVQKCISDRFAVLHTLLDAKEKEFTTETTRLVTEQKDILSHIQKLIDHKEKLLKNSSELPSSESNGNKEEEEEEERLLTELRGPTGFFTHGERLVLDLHCAGTAGLHEAARISAFIGTLDASHVTYPIITNVQTSNSRTCHSLEIEWTTDMPDMGLMTYQLEYRNADADSQDGYTLAYEGKENRTVVEDLSENSEYFFRVRVSYDGKLWSKWTADTRGETLPLPCPENIVAVHSPTAISLSWTAVKAHTYKNCVYQVAYRDEDFNETKYKDNPATVEGDGVTSWVVEGLTPQKRYMFTVRAGFEGKWSEWSRDVEVVTQIPRPDSLTTLNVTPVSLTVSWHLDTTETVKHNTNGIKTNMNEDELITSNKNKNNKGKESDLTLLQQNRGNGNNRRKGRKVAVSPSPPPPSHSITAKKPAEKRKKVAHKFQAELTRLQDNEVVSTYTGTSVEVTFEGLTPETKYSLRVRAEWDGVWGKWCSPLEIETEWSKYFKWMQCPPDVKRKRAYIMDDLRGRIVTANTAASGDEHCTVLGAAPFLANCVTSWEIHVLKSKENNGNLIYVGVAPAEMKQDNVKSISQGWFFSCYKSTLFSGKPSNFWSKEYGPRKTNGEYVKTGDSVCATIDMTTGKLSFSLKHEGETTDLGVAFEDIPLDKPLVPAVIMYNCGDSIEFK